MARKLIPGVYRISHIATGNCYIGSSKHVHDRCHEHQRLLRKGTHINRHLQSAWNKYGEDAFACDVLEECALDIVVEREQYWIDVLAPAYNIRKIAESNLGMKMPEIAKERRYQTWLKSSPEEKEAARQNLAKGRQKMLAMIANGEGKKSPETIEKIKKARAKQKTTPAMLEALKQGQEVRKRVNPKPRLGMKNTPEAIEKARATKSKLSKERSVEIREKTYQPKPRREFSTEHRQSLSESKKVYWANKRTQAAQAETIQQQTLFD